jgi:hypothetical protein
MQHYRVSSHCHLHNSMFSRSWQVIADLLKETSARWLSLLPRFRPNHPSHCIFCGVPLPRFKKWSSPKVGVPISPYAKLIQGVIARVVSCRMHLSSYLCHLPRAPRPVLLRHQIPNAPPKFATLSASTLPLVRIHKLQVVRHARARIDRVTIALARRQGPTRLV